MDWWVVSLVYFDEANSQESNLHVCFSFDTSDVETVVCGMAFSLMTVKYKVTPTPAMHIIANETSKYQMYK